MGKTSKNLLTGRQLAKYLGIYPPDPMSTLSPLFYKTCESDFSKEIDYPIAYKYCYMRLIDRERVYNFIDYFGLMYIEPKDKNFREQKRKEFEDSFAKDWAYLKMSEDERKKALIIKLDKECRLHARISFFQNLEENQYYTLNDNERVVVDVLYRLNLLEFYYVKE